MDSATGRPPARRPRKAAGADVAADDVPQDWVWDLPGELLQVSCTRRSLAGWPLHLTCSSPLPSKDDVAACRTHLGLGYMSAGTASTSPVLQLQPRNLSQMHTLLTRPLTCCHRLHFFWLLGCRRWAAT